MSKLMRTFSVAAKVIHEASSVFIAGASAKVSQASVFRRRYSTAVVDWADLARQKEKVMGYEPGSVAKAIEIAIGLLLKDENGGGYSKLSVADQKKLERQMIGPMILSGLGGNLEVLALKAAEEVIQDRRGAVSAPVFTMK